MAFGFVGSAQDGSNSSSKASVTHGQTINEGDLVVAFVNSNHTGAVSNDAGGSAWSNPINVQPSGQTARMALFWKKAGASEPSVYEWSLNATTYYRAIVMVFSCSGDPVIDAPATHTIDSSSSNNLVCEAIDNAIISNDAVSIVFGGKDNRSSSSSFTTADNSFTGVTGDRANQCAAGAYRIYTTGETFSGSVEISGATNLSDNTYSVHVSFVESAASGNSGTGTGTLGTITASGSGNVISNYTGTGTGDLTSITATSSGVLAYTGSVSGVLSTITGNATGNGAFTGSASGTLASITANSLGVLSYTGPASASLTAITGNASGSHTNPGTFTGTGSAELEGITGAASGTITSVYSGSASGALETITSASTGLIEVTGAGQGQLGSIEASGTLNAGGVLKPADFVIVAKVKPIAIHSNHKPIKIFHK